jgi:hypothetical protein
VVAVADSAEEDSEMDRGRIEGIEGIDLLVVKGEADTVDVEGLEEAVVLMGTKLLLLPRLESKLTPTPTFVFSESDSYLRKTGPIRRSNQLIQDCSTNGSCTVDA